MQPQRKPVNLFAIRSKQRTYADVVPTNAMYGMEATDVVTERIKGIVPTDGLIEITHGIEELQFTDARTDSLSSALDHSSDGSSGKMDSHFTDAESSTLAGWNQSESLKPEAGAQAGSSALCRPATPADRTGQRVQEQSATGPDTGTGQTAAASSVEVEITFRLNDGSTMPLSAYGDLTQLSRVAFQMLRRIAAKYESNPALRVTREQLLEIIGRLRSSRGA